MDRASVAWPLPLEVETVPEALERTAASLVELLPVAHEAGEEITHKRTKRPSFFSREDARFAEQLGVDSQRYFSFHWSSASVGCRVL